MWYVILIHSNTSSLTGPFNHREHADFVGRRFVKNGDCKSYSLMKKNKKADYKI